MKKKAFLFLLTFFFVFFFAGCDFFRGADDPTTNTDDPALTTTTTQKTDTTTRTATETTNPDTTDIPQEIDIIFRDWDSTLLHAQTVGYGFNATGIAPTPPPRPNYLLYTYTFAGWDDQITNITYTKTVYAVYSRDFVSVSNYDVSAVGNLVQKLTGLSNPITRSAIIDYMQDNYNTVSEHELFDVLNIANSVKEAIESSDPSPTTIMIEIEAYLEFFYLNENEDTVILTDKLLEFIGYLSEVGDPYLSNMLLFYQQEIENELQNYEAVVADITARTQLVANLCELSENEYGECDEWWSYHTNVVEYYRAYQDAKAGIDFSKLDLDRYEDFEATIEDYIFALYISLENVEHYQQVYEDFYNTFTEEEKTMIDPIIPSFELYQMNYNFTQVLAYPALEAEMIDGKSVMQRLQEYFYGWTDEDENYHPSYEGLHNLRLDCLNTIEFMEDYIEELTFNYNYIDLLAYYLEKAGS